MTALHEQVWRTLEQIPDPELPISIVDLGIVQHVEEADGHVLVTLIPTFVGCPALNVVQDEIRRQVGLLPGVAQVTVLFRYDPPWTPERMSDRGRRTLKQLGVGVPDRSSCIGVRVAAGQTTKPDRPVPCPWCDSTNTELSSAFGPQRCRMVYYCRDCKKPFEQFKSM